MIGNDEQTETFLTIAMRVSQFLTIFSLFSLSHPELFTHIDACYIQNSLKVHFFCDSGWAPERKCADGKMCEKVNHHCSSLSIWFLFWGLAKRRPLIPKFKPIWNYPPPKKNKNKPLDEFRETRFSALMKLNLIDDWIIKLFVLNFHYPYIIMFEEATHHLTNTVSMVKHGGGEWFSLDWRLVTVEGETK